MSLLDDRIIREFTAAPVVVSTLTVLSGFETFGERLENIAYFCLVIGGSEQVTFVLETTEEDPALSATPRVDDEQTVTKICAPDKQASFDIAGERGMRTRWRISAHTDSPGFNPANVKFRIKAQVRR